MDAVDLRDVPVVDNHCHGILRPQRFDDITSWRRASTEVNRPRNAARARRHDRLLPASDPILSSFFECKPDEETVFTVLPGRDAAELTGELLGSANVETLPSHRLPATRRGYAGR